MAQPTPERRLDSWKEIAAYLKRDQRTAQRWARERGLPVHHVPGGARGSVFAYAEEIDAWLSRQPSESPATLQDETSEAAALPSPGLRRIPRVSVWLAGAALALIVTSVALRALRSPARAEVDHISFAGRMAEARDARGQLLWEYALPGAPAQTVVEVNGFRMPATRVADLDGDGRAEVVILVSDFEGQQARESSVVYCLSGDGRLLWSYQPQEQVRFAEREFGGPWHVFDMRLLPEEKGHSLWLAVVHHMWWPSYVMRVDSRGHAEMRFLHSGSIYALSTLRTPEGRYVLAGGFNNEAGGGFLAVLSAEESSGASPQGAESPFRCVDCPRGDPVQYFVFPRTEVNRLQESYSTNHVYEIVASAEHVAVSTSELWPNRAIYEFSAGSLLAPRVASLSDGFQQAHRRLEEAARVKHPFEQCPDETQPLKARLWTRDAGWREIVFPRGAHRVPERSP